MKYLPYILPTVVLLVLLALGCFTSAPGISPTDAPAEAPAEAQSPEPAETLNGDWSVKWIGSTRFMHRDGVWHVWAATSEWIPLPNGMTPEDMRPRTVETPPHALTDSR